MPTANRGLAAKIATVGRRHDNDYPLWQGPCADGPLGGVTQSMLGRFLSCRECFRLKYIVGLEPPDRWNHRLGYGNMWHVCEESLAGADGNWLTDLEKHTAEQLAAYPLQREEIVKWYSVCRVQFPEYVKHWAEHPDVLDREPLMQEEVFDVPYALPSRRKVRLRGKIDSADQIIDDVSIACAGPDGGVYVQENKTKGDIDKLQVERQLKFDLQTMLYLIALGKIREEALGLWGDGVPILGVRYNVVRRPLSGGRGSIRPHIAKATKNKFTPAETDEEFYERLRRDYIAAEPDYWFFRVRSEVSARDVQVFRETCLDPLLETVCWWYEQVTNRPMPSIPPRLIPFNYRTPFGVYNPLADGRETEYDHFLATGSEAGLRRIETMFPELTDGDV